MYFFLMVVGVFIGGLFLFFFLAEIKADRFAKVVIRSLAPLLLLLLVSPLIYEYPETDVVVVSRHSGNPQPWGMFALEDGYSYINVPRKGAVSKLTGDASMSVEGLVHPVTPNPKVRNFRYRLWLEVVDYKVFLKEVPFYLSETTDVAEYCRKKASYWLYEFNDQYSKDMGGFHNPLDPKQQARFKTLLEAWINERLAKVGLQAEVDQFWID